MNAPLRVFKNSTALSASILLERGIIFILPWYVARVLGRTAWGNYSTAYTFVLIGAIIAPWGLVSLLPRQIARDPKYAPAALLNGSFIGFGIGTITAVLMLLLTRLLNYAPEVETLIFIGILTIILPQTEATLFESVIQGLERMEWIVFVRLPATVLRIAGSIYLLANGYGISILFFALSIYHLFNCFAYALIFRRYYRHIRLKLNISEIRLLFIQALPFFIIVSTSETFKQTDRIFLSKLWDTDAVGIYTTGIMFVQLLYMLAPALMGALFPGLSRTYVKSTARFAYLVSWLFKLLAVIMFPISLFTVTFADRMILFVFGPEYEPSINVLRLVALGILPSFLSRILYRAILASDNERLAVYIALVGNSASLLLNILLIPRFGVLGASMAAVGTILVNLGQNFWCVNRLIRFDFRRAIGKPGFCILLSTLTYSVILLYNDVWAFLAAAAMFIFLLWLTGTIGGEDLTNLSLVRGKD